MSYKQKWKTNRESGPEIVLKHDGNPLVSGQIWVNGVQVEVLSAKVYRDGGSQRFVTGEGDLFLNRKLGDDHYETWGGEVLIEVEDDDETLPVQTCSEEGALRYFKTINDAVNYANKPRNKVWKISWYNTKTNERVRLIKFKTQPGSHVWVYEDIFTGLGDKT